MLTTTHRGWWPALEPALLAFAAVVCSGVSLLALSQAFASDCRHQCDTTRSSYWTVAAADQDPLDDDDDDAPDASVAATIVLTSDDGFGRLLVEREFDAASTPRREQLVPRGPPDRTRASHNFPAPLPYALSAAASPDPLHWTSAAPDSVDDGDDDGDNDDDDDGVDDAGDAIAAQTILQTHDDTHHPVIANEFGVALTLRAENIAARGPPVVQHSPACPAHLSAPNPDDASDVDVTDSDEDDDDDDGAELDRWSVAATRGSDCLLITANVHHFCSFASHDHSLRAPPQ